MKRYRFDEFIVVNAGWLDIFKCLITRGKKGKLYTVIKNPPPQHVNCRCNMAEQIK